MTQPLRIVRALFSLFSPALYVVQGDSMMPSLASGDSVLAVRVRPPKGRLRRGEMVVLRNPVETGHTSIKRVIGLPGEVVEVRGREVLIDGIPLEETYTRYNDHGDQGNFAGRERFGPVRVPGGHVFMMGDNRDNSLDSRAWGFLNMDKVRGEAFIIYWSCKKIGLSCLLPGNVRWNRFGHLLF